MTFVEAQSLALLFALPLAVLATWWLRRRARRFSQRLAPARLRTSLLPESTPGRLWSRLVWRLLALVLLTLALARPQWGESEIREIREGRDIILAIDVSRSMLARDAAPDRLEFARLAALDFVDSRPPGDRFAVIAFAGVAFTIAPLTDDREAIRSTLLDLDTDIVPVGGTRIASALETAASLVEGEPPRRRAMLLFTDGDDLEGNLDQAIRTFNDANVSLLALGIGGENGELIPLPEGGFVNDLEGRPVVTRRDMASLERIAANTGGAALPLNRADNLPILASQTLGQIDRLDVDTLESAGTAERFQWFLLPALLCLIASMLHRSRLIRKATAPASAPQPASATLSATTAAVLWLALPPATAPAQPAASPAESPEGQESPAFPDLAADARALLRGTESARARAAYNIGTRLYQHGRNRIAESPQPDLDTLQTTRDDLRDALSHLEYATRTAPTFADAADNLESARTALDFVERMVEELTPPPPPEDPQPEPDDEPDDPQDGDEDQDPQPGEDNGEEDATDEENGDDPTDPGDDENGTDADTTPDDDGRPEDGEDGENGEPGDDLGDSPPSDDASTGDATPDHGQAIDGANLPVDEQGNWILPADPAERERALEAIRRTMEQRADEDHTVRLPEDIPPHEPTRRNW